MTLLVLSLFVISPVNSQQTMKREETLYFFLDGGRRASPFQYNPFLYGFISYAGLTQICIEYLAYYNLATGELLYWLATGYDLSSDYKTLTIRLREGVKWNDGEPFTAKDVVFTYNMLLTPHTPPLSWESSVQDVIESVEIVDDYTVLLHLKKPNPRIHYTGVVTVTDVGALAIVPEHIWKDVDPTNFTNPDAVFTGPYKLIEASATGDRFVYERRDDWWATEVLGLRPAPKYCVWQWYANIEATTLAVAGDRLDLGDILTADPYLSLKEKNPYVRSFHDSAPWGINFSDSRVLFINNERYPWNNKEARWALSYVLDRNALNEIGQAGISPPYPGFFSPYLAKKWERLMLEKAKEYPLITYDTAKTAQIFTSLGWTKGADGIWVTDNGTRVTFDLLISADWEYYTIWGKQMVDQLRAVGIDASENVAVWGPFSDKWMRGDFDGCAWCIVAGETVNEPFGALKTFHSKNWVPLGEPAYTNEIRFRNETCDSIIDQMELMSPDDPAYVDLVSRALDVIYQEMPLICTIQDTAVIPYNTKYWTGWPTSDSFYTIGHLPYPISGHEYILHLMPTEIPTGIVYFTKDIQKLRGIDQVWYGPFKPGDAARIPLDDAEYWIRMGKASYTPPAVSVVDISGLTNLVQDLKTSGDITREKIDSLTSMVEGLINQTSALTTVAYIEGAVIIVLIIVIVVLMLRKPKAAEIAETE